MDRSIEKLKQAGNISLVKFKVNYRNYPGWHFIADEAGREFLIGLLDLMAASEWPSRRILLVADPTRFGRRVPNWESKDRWVVPKSLELVFRREGADWEVGEGPGTARFEFAASGMAKFKEAIARNASGENDFAIGEGSLWFW